MKKKKNEGFTFLYDSRVVCTRMDFRRVCFGVVNNGCDFLADTVSGDECFGTARDEGAGAQLITLNKKKKKPIACDYSKVFIHQKPNLAIKIDCCYNAIRVWNARQ